jgi:hypothetical protein
VWHPGDEIPVRWYAQPGQKTTLQTPGYVKLVIRLIGPFNDKQEARRWVEEGKPHLDSFTLGTNTWDSNPAGAELEVPVDATPGTYVLVEDIETPQAENRTFTSIVVEK